MDKLMQNWILQTIVEGYYMEKEYALLIFRIHLGTTIAPRPARFPYVACNVNSYYTIFKLILDSIYLHMRNDDLLNK